MGEMRSAAIRLAAFAAAAAASVAAAPDAPACHPSLEHELSVNLDGDRAREVVVAFQNASCDHRHQDAAVEIRDRCGSRTNNYRLTPRLASLGVPRIADAVEVLEADGATRRPETFFAIAGSSPDGRVGIAKVVRLVDRRSGCPAPRALFSYSTAAVAPGDAPVSWNVDVRNVTRTYAGKEVVLTELLRSPPPPEGALGPRRVRLYRYDRRAGRYVVYGDKTIAPA